MHWNLVDWNLVNWSLVNWSLVHWSFLRCSQHLARCNQDLVWRNRV